MTLLGQPAIGIQLDVAGDGSETTSVYQHRVEDLCEGCRRREFRSGPSGKGLWLSSGSARVSLVSRLTISARVSTRTCIFGRFAG